MTEIVSKNKTEDLVFDYIIENTKDYSTFNPVRLSASEIAKNINLEASHVEEALDKLSSGSPRIERIWGNFEFWLPLNQTGKKIKEELFESNLAYYNIFLFSFIFIVLFYFLINWLVIKRYPNLIKTTTDYFFTGVIITAISIQIAKSLINKYYIISEKIKNVKGYKYYIWLFVILTSAIVYLINKGLEDRIYFYVALIANLLTIIKFFIDFKRQK